MTPAAGRIGLALLAGIAAAASPRPASGQASAALEIGTGTTSLGGATGVGILSLAPELALDAGRFSFDASGTFADHLRRGWRSQGRGEATMGADLGDGFFGEAEAEGGWSELSWGGTRRGWLGTGRMGFASGPHRISFGAGLGRHSIRSDVQPLTRLEARGRSRVAGVRVGWLLSRTAVRSPGTSTNATAEPLLGLDTLELGPVDGRRFIQDHYTDAAITLGIDRTRLGVEAGIGHRFAKPVAQYTHWHLRGTFRLIEGLALVGAVGRYPYDVVSGLPRGSFATLSARMTLGRERRRIVATPVAPTPLPQTRRVFALAPLGEGLYQVSIVAPGARSVELMGSFTDWSPVALAPRPEGRWVWGFPIAPGVHHFNVRQDGGAWSVPPGVRTLPGEFGTVGVLVITDELTP